MSVAVITGGAGGLGRALCAQLVASGWQVVLIDLPSDQMAALAGPQVQVEPCDLTDPVQSATTCTRIAAQYPAIDLVIYNAGITQIAPFAESDLSAHRRVVEVNYFGAITVAHHLLGPVRQAQGVHMAISSVAGFSALHHRTSYAASKHALEGFFKSLRSEEKPHGVACLIAAPSFVATNIGSAQTNDSGIARPGSAPDGIDYMTPDMAARLILHACETRRAFTPIGRIARLAWWLNRLSPTLFQKQMEKRIAGK